MNIQSYITHWEQYIARQRYLTNEEQKGSQSSVPEDNSDQSHVEEEFPHPNAYQNCLGGYKTV